MSLVEYVQGLTRISHWPYWPPTDYGCSRDPARLHVLYMQFIRASRPFGKMRASVLRDEHKILRWNDEPHKHCYGKCIYINWKSLIKRMVRHNPSWRHRNRFNISIVRYRWRYSRTPQRIYPMVIPHSLLSSMSRPRYLRETNKRAKST